jgi:23S rRNA (cytidine1920-2'-O)/16S rRNA (cytidine1409-2'-O)-methyltransferase
VLVTVTRRRLDTELVRRGLASSRAEAQEAVRAGLVMVSGSTATKAASMVADDQPVTVTSPARRFVSRGGEKLDAALHRFAIDPEGLDCVDAGASTGGFTDRLLRGGAARVIAIDVGYGQLAWELRSDERVTVMERTNVRRLQPEDLPFVPSLVVADLSFISLTAVIEPLARVARPDAVYVLLVKPQFEAGPDDVGKGGVVRSPTVWRRVLGTVGAACTEAGIHPAGVMASPIRGPAGNVEFLLWAVAGTSVDGPAMVPQVDVDAAIAEGEGVSS